MVFIWNRCLQLSVRDSVPLWERSTRPFATTDPLASLLEDQMLFSIEILGPKIVSTCFTTDEAEPSKINRGS